MGDFKTGIDFENHTSHPSRGDVILYPGGFSEREILLAYGNACFASQVGQLAGNHFLTIVEAAENLAELGRLTLWEGAQNIVFEKLKIGALCLSRGGNNVFRCPTQPQFNGRTAHPLRRS